MANISSYGAAEMLNWNLTTAAAAATRPTQWAINIGLAAPTSTAGSEIATGSGMTRQAVFFNTALSAVGLCTNLTAMTLGPISAGGTIIGIQVWDTTAATIGDLLWVGTLSTSRTMNTGDSLVFNIGALQISLS